MGPAPHPSVLPAPVGTSPCSLELQLRVVLSLPENCTFFPGAWETVVSFCAALSLWELDGAEGDLPASAPHAHLCPVLCGWCSSELYRALEHTKTRLGRNMGPAQTPTRAMGPTLLSPLTFPLS